MQIIETVLDVGPSSKGIIRCNEDALSYGEYHAAIFDGATPASKNGPYVATSDKTDAHWISNTASEIIRDFLDVDDEAIIPQLQTRLSNIFREQSGHDPYNMEETECPSTTVSFALERNGHITFFQLGDSPIFIRKRNGQVTIMHGDPVLINHDKKIQKTLEKRRAHNRLAGLDGLNALRKDTIPNIRDCMNKAGGYGVLTVKPPEVDHLKRLSLPTQDIESFVIMSDGLIEAMDVFKMSDSYEGFYTLLTQSDSGLKDATKKLRALQLEDKEGFAYPRIKIGDDIAAIHARP